jgi:hypothetical protein
MEEMERLRNLIAALRDEQARKLSHLSPEQQDETITGMVEILFEAMFDEEDAQIARKWLIDRAAAYHVTRDLGVTWDQ